MVNAIARSILDLSLSNEVDDLAGHKLRLIGICAPNRL